MIYLDNCATTQITDNVFKSIIPYIQSFYGNPSSTHEMGRIAKQAITTAKKQVAKAINAEPDQIFFTSGATESNNWVCAAYYSVLCSKTEHYSILRQPSCIPVDNFDDLETRKNYYNANLVSQIYVNNETGKYNNIKETAKQAHIAGMDFHTDATQAFGHLPIDVKDLDIDYMSLSGHKFHAPKGVGVLYVKNPDKIVPLLYGGNQENKLRAGTENVLAIVGIGKAAILYKYNEIHNKIILAMKKELKTFIKENIPDVIFNDGDNHINNILSVAFKDIEAESLVAMLDIRGICVSSGSACNSGSLEVSETIKSLNLPAEYENGVIRFSFSFLNTTSEIKAVEPILKETIEILRNARV